MEQERSQKRSHMFELRKEICFGKETGNQVQSPKRVFDAKGTIHQFGPLTFPKIESIIGDSLPTSASQNTHWWNNAPSRLQAEAWMNVEWRVQKVNLNDRTVTFKRVAGPEIATARKRRKRAPALAAKPFQPPKPLTFRRRSPSETRIAKAWARPKNVERRKMSMRRYRGKFKPPSAFEKRLYKPEAKPKK